MENRMSNWNYTREDNERESALTGKHRVVIVDASEGVTGANSKKPGTPMIIVKLRPSGKRFTVTYRMVAGEYFNRNCTQFFDAFPEIADGNFNFLEWVGCEGAAMFKEDSNGYTQVSYFLSPTRAADLPPFEGEKPKRQTVTQLEELPDDGELPF